MSDTRAEPHPSPATSEPALEPADARNPGRGRHRLLSLSERYGLLVVWAVVIGLFSILASQTFPTAANFETIFGTQAVLLVMTLGLLFPLSVAEYDLSVGAVMGMSAIIVAYLNVLHQWPIAAAVAVAILMGLIVGAVNAFLVVGVGLSSFVTTLGMATLIDGLGYGLTSSVTVGGISPGLVTFVTYRIAGLPIAFYVGVALCIVTWYVLQHTPLGRHLVFVGESRDVARLNGLPVSWIRSGTLIACSAIAAIAGVLQAGVVAAAVPGGGDAYLLPAFAGAFLGATTIRPGRFNAWGAFVAVYFLVTGITGLELLGYSGWVQDVFYGGSLIVAVAFARLAGRRRQAIR